MLGAGEPVERRPLLGRAQQPQLVGLAVHGQHLLADLGQQDTGMLRPPTWARERPSIVTVRLSSSEPSSSGSAPASVTRACTVSASGPRSRSRPSTTAPARVGAHPAGVGAAAEQQAQPGHDHGLAGAGLAGDDVHARGQAQRGVVDDAEPGDPQFLQHRADSIGGPPTIAHRPRV